MNEHKDTIQDYVVLFTFPMYLNDTLIIDTINSYADWARENSIPYSLLLTGDPYEDLYPFGIGFRHEDHAMLFRLTFHV